VRDHDVHRVLAGLADNLSGEVRIQGAADDVGAIPGLCDGGAVEADDVHALEVDPLEGEVVEKSSRGPSGHHREVGAGLPYAADGRAGPFADHSARGAQGHVEVRGDQVVEHGVLHWEWVRRATCSVRYATSSGVIGWSRRSSSTSSTRTAHRYASG